MDQLTQQVKTRSDQDDQIIVQVDQKVSEWKALLSDKDARIAQLQQQIVEQRDVIAAHDLDSEKTSVIALSKVGHTAILTLINLWV